MRVGVEIEKERPRVPLLAIHEPIEDDPTVVVECIEVDELQIVREDLEVEELSRHPSKPGADRPYRSRRSLEGQARRAFDKR